MLESMYIKSTAVYRLRHPQLFLILLTIPFTVTYNKQTQSVSPIIENFLIHSKDIIIVLYFALVSGMNKTKSAHYTVYVENTIAANTLIFKNTESFRFIA